MFATDVVALVTQLTCADPAACDRRGLAELVTASQRVRGFLDAIDVSIAVQAARLAETGTCESPGAVLAGGGRRAGRDAEQAARRGQVCDQMPAVHDALADGTVSAGHVDAIARAANQLDEAGKAELAGLEATLVEKATANSVEVFEREIGRLTRILSGDDGTSRLARLKQQRRLRRWADRHTGMCHTHLELDPETDAKVAAALDAAIAAARAANQGDDVDFEHLQVDALVDLITGARSTDPRVPEISVLIDLETLLEGVHDGSVSETGDGQPLPAETIRRLGCDGDIVPIVLGGDGVPLDMGRACRLATRDQRRALRAMYATCAHPGCQVRFEACRIHHVTWWDHHGPTDLANLLPLCERHHHLVHEGHWSLTLKPDRTITLRRPDGSLYFEGDTTVRAPRPVDGDEPRPTETNIPLHLRQAARPHQTTAAATVPEPEPTPCADPDDRPSSGAAASGDPRSPSTAPAAADHQQRPPPPGT